jgi:small subunit ribosomal protein S6
MRTYEVIFIIRPDTPEGDIDALVESLQQAVRDSGGQVSKAEKWGKRPLAYRVERQREGFYVLFEVEGAGDSLRELERRLKVAEPVIKFLSVRVDLERKKHEKLRHRREHQAARKQRAAGATAPSGGEPRQADMQASA